MSTPTIRAALERLIAVADSTAWSANIGTMDDAIAAARAALAEPVGEDRWYPSFADWLEREMPEGTVIGDPLWWASKIASYLARWGRPATPPALPPGYIDPEHHGEDRELLEAFYRACAAEGGTADEIHLRGLRAVLAARPTAPPAPEPPEVGKLARCLADSLAGFKLTQDPSTYPADHWSRRAATLLQQLSAPALAAVPVAVSDELRQIGHRLRTQDNRCTADPIFQVRGLRRYYGMDPDYASERVWIDTEDGEREVDPPDKPDNPGNFIVETGYLDVWEVLMVAFTEEGCKEHLRLNGHNYRRIYKKVDIYASYLNRCPEMIAIRNALMALPLPQGGEGES